MAELIHVAGSSYLIYPLPFNALSTQFDATALLAKMIYIGACGM